MVAEPAGGGEASAAGSPERRGLHRRAEATQLRESDEVERRRPVTSTAQPPHRRGRRQRRPRRPEGSRAASSSLSPRRFAKPRGPSGSASPVSNLRPPVTLSTAPGGTPSQVAPVAVAVALRRPPHHGDRPALLSRNLSLRSLRSKGGFSRLLLHSTVLSRDRSNLYVRRERDPSRRKASSSQATRSAARSPTATPGT